MINEENFNMSSSLTVFSTNYKNFHSPLVVVICLFGVVCNVANVIVLTKPKMRTSPTNVILTGLSLAQICLLINYLCYTIYGVWDADECNESTKSYRWLIYLLLNVNLNVLFHTIGLVHTSLIAVFRYIAVAFAATHSHWVTVRRAKQAVVATYAFVPLACATFYFNSQIVEKCLSSNCTSANVGVDPRPLTICNNTSTGVVLYELAFTDNVELLAYNFWMLATVCKLLPCFCLVVLSALLLVELHKVQQRRRRLHRQSSTTTIGDDQQHQRITIMLIVVVLLFVFVEMPQGIFNLLSAVGGFESIRSIHEKLADFFDMLTVSYSSVNFVLYCTMSSQFRQSFGEIFFCSFCTLKWKSRRKNQAKRSRAVYIPVRGIGDASPSTMNGLLASSSVDV